SRECFSGKVYYIDKTNPYTPIIKWTKTSIFNGHQIKTGHYGECVGGSFCGGSMYSLTLQSQGKACCTERRCNYNTTAKIYTSRSCAFRKTEACGEPWPVEDAGDSGGSGVKGLYSNYVNKSCQFTWRGYKYYTVWGWEYYVIDNAGNRSASMYF